MDRRVAVRRTQVRREADQLMPVTVEIKPATLLQLQEKAQRQGKTLDEYLCELMEREVER
jgi:hypothetical protein